MQFMFEGQQGGVTHIEFSKDGNYLFTGGRKVDIHDINTFLSEY